MIRWFNDLISSHLNVKWTFDSKSALQTTLRLPQTEPRIRLSNPSFRPLEPRVIWVNKINLVFTNKEYLFHKLSLFSKHYLDGFSHLCEVRLRITFTFIIFHILSHFGITFDADTATRHQSTATKPGEHHGVVESSTGVPADPSWCCTPA